MQTSLHGTIRQKTSHPCPQSHQSLSVKVYTKTLFSETEVKTLSVLEDGTFTTELNHKERKENILLRLFWEQREDKPILLAESGPHCATAELQVAFDIDLKKHLFWFPYLDRKLIPLMEGREVVGLQEEHIAPLACLACKEEQDIRAWRQAYLWAHKATVEAQKYQSIAKSLMGEDDYYFACFHSMAWLREQNLAHLLYAFAEQGNTQPLHQILTLSKQQLLSHLQGAVTKKQVNFAQADLLAFSEALAFLRDHLLLHTRYDERYYDAKIIAAGRHDRTTDHELLNATLEAGSLRTFLSEEAAEDKAFLNQIKHKRSLFKTLRKEKAKPKLTATTKEKDKLKRRGNPSDIPPYVKQTLEDIVAWDARLQHFPPFLDKMVGEFYNQAWFISNFYRYDKDEWFAKIEQLEIAQPYPDVFKETENPIAAYAEAIAEQNEVDYPSYQLLTKMEKSDFKNKERLRELLDKIHDFDIQKTAVSRYFTVVPNPGELGFVTQEEYELLQTFQRCIKLADGIYDFNTVVSLMNADMTSAVKIVQKGKYKFQELMEAMGMPFPVAHTIYCRAKATNDTTKEMAMNYVLYERPNSFVPQALKQKVSVNTKRGGGNLPNMETLFGNMDTCHCKHCQSVYSPAAYLTDMLHWLSGDVVCQVSNQTAYAALDSRRPDIKYLQLNCKNAHTLMPYIDLVNEVLLANMVGNPSVNLMKQLQTNEETEQLMVEPEHLGHTDFDAAKALLQAAKYPLSLPYDMEWSESRAYLEKLGIGHAELLQVFGDNDDPYYEDITWAKAYLGLSEGEYELLIENTPIGDFWKDYLNLDGQTKNLGQLLDALEMDKATFQAIYETKFVKGRNLLPKEEDFTDCSWDEFEISSTLTPILLHKLLRFVRLQKASGLKTWQLDELISNHSSRNIVEQLIIHIAGVLVIGYQLKLPVEDLVFLFSVNSFRYDTGQHWVNYYDAIYRQKHFSRERLDFFARDYIDSSLNTLDSNAFSIEQLNWLNEVYGFANEDIKRLNFYRQGNTAASTFRTFDLVFYQVHAILSKALGLSITELLVYLEKIGIQKLGYFVIIKPSELLDFIEKVKKFQKVNIPIQTFAELDDGTGKYELDSAGQAVDDTFDTEAKAIWEVLAREIPIIFANNPNMASNNNYRRDIFFETIAAELGIEVETTKYIVFTARNDFYIHCLNHISNQDDWSISRKTFTPVYRFIIRTRLYQKTLGLTDLDLKNLINIKTNISNYHFPITDALGWLDYTFNNNFNSYIWFNSLLTYQKKYQLDFIPTLSKMLMISHFTGSQELANSTFDTLLSEVYQDWQIALHEELSIEQFKLIYIRAQALASNPKDLIEVLDLFFKIWKAAKKWQLPVSTLWDWVWDSYDLSSKQLVPLAQHHEQLKNTLRSKYDTFEAWAKAITPLHNQFRTQLRDALVAYYIAHKGFKNSAAIYAHFLLDPKMEACMKTSRIKLATAGVQLLMHRAMMGLEADVCPDEDDKTEWKWRKNYRVWEANRKVFLYPENWIDPSLRLDKTPFFASLEDALLQDDINAENTEKALSTYLTQLHEVARLDIRAFYMETEKDNEEGVIHVVGRTFSTPHVYFYRTRDIYKKWTAWQQLDLDIEGEHLMLIFVNRRLYMYWPMFIEKEHRKIKRVIEGEEQNAPYFEIKMCYSKLEFGKWTPKKILDGTMMAGHYAGLGCYNNLRYKLGQDRVNEDTSSIYVLSNDVFQDYTQVSMEKRNFYFWPEVIDGVLFIHSLRSYTEGYDDWHNGYSGFGYEDGFKIDACTGQVEIIPPIIIESDSRFLARPFYTLNDSQQFKEGLDGPSEEAKGIYVKNQRIHLGGSIRILQRSQGSYQLTYPAQHKDAMWHLPFFLGDRKRTHFLEREWETKCGKRWIKPINGQTSTYYVPYSYKEQSLKYTVQPHQHPLACLMLEEFNQYGVEGLLASKNEDLKRQRAKNTYFRPEYVPVAAYIKWPYPFETFNFDCFAAYGQYNWELFYHAPSLIARQLKNNGQYAEAIRWLQFVFDPTNRDMSDGANRFWRIKPFFEGLRDDSIQNLLKLLGATGLSSAEEKKRKAFQAQIEIWRDQPFQPHLIAELRIRPYMLWTVCEYIDVLVEWADSLFRQDTMESINEATNLYILAAELLGPRPKTIHKISQEKTTYFHQIKNGLDEFSNALINVENEIINLDTKVCCEEDPYAADKGFQLPDLMFCVPHNPKLLEIWNRVEDRLFKIRHCMNIEGQVRELALFEPPIDPGLLVRATAAGIDIGEILAGLNAPESCYRSSYLLQKANEFANEVKSLGGQLLSALEKRDAESLSLIRQRHEQNMLNASKAIKKMQVEEAKQNLASMRHSQQLIEIRLAEYEGKEYMNRRETDALKQTKISEGFMYVEQGLNLIAAPMTYIPEIYVGFPSNFADIGGGDKIATSFKTAAMAFGILSSVFRNKASMSSTYAGYDRRQEDWDFQVKTAKEELKQMDKQLLAAEIRLAIAEKDLVNHELQIQQSQEIYDFLKYKFTNVQLYTWMAGEVSQLYYRAYQLAYDMAKQAERAMVKEIDLTGTVIQAENWDSSYKGLMSGEKLSFQLKELDDAYIKQNKRKFELSTNISLKLLDARALINLIQHKYCKIDLTPDLFQLEFGGKKLSNIKIRSIAVSIPCVTGPHISTHVKLRKEGGEEMVTSTGINDSGIFEPNFNAPRYLPFEYLLVDDDDATWELILNENSDFDLTTISDVVLHIRYEAENGDGTESLGTANMPVNKEFHLMSWRHDFPLEWQGLLKEIRNGIPSNEPGKPILKIEHIPYQNRADFNQATSISDIPYFLYKNGEKMMIEPFDTDDWALLSLDSIGTLKRTIQIDNMSVEQKVEDIWLLYQLKYSE